MHNATFDAREADLAELCTIIAANTTSSARIGSIGVLVG
jgi:hypothetical protein